MESRCGTGRRRDCLCCYKDRGSLWGAWRENVGTTLKFVWMPLSTIWCNVQFGMWHFKWKLCFPDESDLGRVELEGVLYFEPYLTAWINNPLFCCWAGAHPLLMLSFNNHARVLSPLVYSITYRNNSEWVRAQWSIILLVMLAWLRFLQFEYCSEYMSAPIT